MSRVKPVAMAPAQRAAVFVDKDGTLVDNVPYNVDPALLRFRPGAPQAMAALSRRGFDIVIVTNQSGLARGLFTLDELLTLRDALYQRLLDASGVRLRGFLFCPHGVDADGQPLCLCRKPLPGMLHEARDMYGIDLQRSWMIGDTLDDVQAGHHAGCRSILYDSGGETLWRAGPGREPFARTTDWSAVEAIIARDRPPWQVPHACPGREAFAGSPSLP